MRRFDLQSLMHHHRLEFVEDIALVGTEHGKSGSEPEFGVSFGVWLSKSASKSVLFHVLIPDWTLVVGPIRPSDPSGPLIPARNHSPWEHSVDSPDWPDRC
jgi:hypothetical protein